MRHIHVPEIQQKKTRCELAHDLATYEECQLVARIRRFRAVDVLNQATLERVSNMLVQLSPAPEDRPADALVAGIQDALQLPPHVFPVGHALVEAALDDFVHCLEQ